MANKTLSLFLCNARFEQKSAKDIIQLLTMNLQYSSGV